MVTARHDSGILAALAVVFSASVLLAWRPAPHERPFVTPRAPSPAARTHPAPRPPRVVPAAPAAPRETPRPAPAPVADDGRPAATSETRGATIQLEDITIMGSSYEGSSESYGYYGRPRHWGRRRWYNRGRWWGGAYGRAAMSGSPMFFVPPGADGRGLDACEAFPRACGTSAPRAPGGGRRNEGAATVRREGSRWLLANDVALVTVDVARLCELAVERRDELPGTVAPAPSLLAFATPDDARACTVEPTGSTHGAGVVIDWQGPGWSQRVTVSLDDDATHPEAAVAYTETWRGGATTTHLANLGDASLSWSLGGTEVDVAPGHVVRVTSR